MKLAWMAAFAAMTLEGHPHVAASVTATSR
jgi:hypothetical protein